MIVMSFIIALATAFVVMLCWNFVMPVIFGLPELAYWQAYALQVLAIILVKPGMAPQHHSHE